MKKHTSKLLSMLLALIMLLSMLPMAALAADPAAPQFVTKDQLKTFDTDATNGDNAAKVYFGDNNQQWYIAGSQSDNSIVLFATKAVGSNAKFESDWNSTKRDPSLWADCTYPDGTTIKYVQSNHYGASSTLRDTMKKLETSFFTAAEQNLILPTTIYTSDTDNKSVYAISDKLYAPQGDIDTREVFVGANAPDALNSGLRMDKEYGPKVMYWLRTPDKSTNQDHNAMVVTSNGSLNSISVKSSRAVVPAFQLNLSTVLFASNAPAATADGTVATGDALTLRYTGRDLGAAEISADKTQVLLTNVPADTYLMVQNGTDILAKKLDNLTTVSAADMGEGFTSFADCKVWLEQNDAAENKTYAAMATNVVLYQVQVSEAEGIAVTSGNAAQTVKAGTAIEPIVLEAAPEYVLPADYESTIEGLNGLTVAREGDTITISGVPASDTTVTLKALGYKDADYSKVDAAIEKANALKEEDYKDFSAVEAAINAVVRDKNITEQETVDGYAAAIEAAIKALEYKDADYSKVDAAIEKANALKKEDYKDFSAVEAAINAVVRGKNITEQETVDGYAAAIEEALKGLEKKPADVVTPTEDPTKPTDAPKPVTPQTGDSVNLVLLVTLCAVSLVGLVVVFAFFFKNRRKAH